MMLSNDDDDDGFFEVYTEGKKSCNKKLNIPRRNCMKTNEKLEKVIKDTITGYKEIIFGEDTPACMACLDELQKQQVIDEEVYDQS